METKMHLIYTRILTEKSDFLMNSTMISLLTSDQMTYLFNLASIAFDIKNLNNKHLKLCKKINVLI